jgi:hypothetical protein
MAIPPGTFCDALSFVCDACDSSCKVNDWLSLYCRPVLGQHLMIAHLAELFTLKRENRLENVFNKTSVHIFTMRLYTNVQ